MAGSQVITLRLAYVGWNYHGVVKQPGLRTVQAELEEALRDQGIEVNLKFASRTDKGVSALENIAFYIGRKPIISWLNSSLPDDIAVWGLSTFESPIRPSEKTYLYVVPFSIEKEELVKGLNEATKLPRLCKEGSAPPPDKYDVVRSDDFTFIYISGKSFCWQMVRRIVGRALSLVTGVRMGVAPPEGLILLRTKANIEWEEVNTKKLMSVKNHLEREMWRWGAGIWLGRLIERVISLEL